MEHFSVGPDVFTKIMSFVCAGPIPRSWSQPFVFKPESVSLLQYEGGPCGLMAAVQAHVLLLQRQKPSLTSDDLLVEAVLEIMSLIRPCYLFCSRFDPDSQELEWDATQNREEAAKYLHTTKFLKRENAAVLLTVSLAILVGPIWLKSYALPDTFITEDGQTNMTFLLLMISGDILDSYHDGNTVMGGLVIKGALTPRPIGVLSIGDRQGVQRSGGAFKKPTHRIWVAYYGGHFTTIIATNQAFYEFDPLSHNVLFRPVTDKHVLWDDLRIGAHV